MPVGSITPERIEPYWRAGARGFGLGSALYRPGDAPETVARSAAAFREALERVRTGEPV
jgi:2-dehydro-3-deoxyphosphogalactonate aldolase